MIEKLNRIKLIDALSFILAYLIILLFNISPIIPAVAAIIISLSNKFVVYNLIEKKLKKDQLILFGVKTKRNRNYRMITGISGIVVLSSITLFIFKNPNEVFWWLFGGIALTGTIEALFSVTRWTVIIEGDKLIARAYNIFPINLTSKLKIRRITDSKIELYIGNWTHCINFDSEEINQLEEVIAQH